MAALVVTSHMDLSPANQFDNIKVFENSNLRWAEKRQRQRIIAIAPVIKRYSVVEPAHQMAEKDHVDVGVPYVP